MAEPRSNSASLKTQLTRLAVFAVVLGLLWLGRRYGLIEGDAPAPPPVVKTKPTTSATADEKPQAATRPTEPPPKQVASAPKTAASKTPSPTTTSPSASQSDPLVVRNLTLRDQDGETIYRGDIDLRPTLERIVAGRKLRFSHDGTTFGNRERRLPQKSSGYYQEWVVPTPGENGPGPQRLVTGADGDVWYTADHYLSFRRVPYKLPALESATDR